jgi:hypothetical protein
MHTITYPPRRTWKRRLRRTVLLAVAGALPAASMVLVPTRVSAVVGANQSIFTGGTFTTGYNSWAGSVVGGALSSSSSGYVQVSFAKFGAALSSLQYASVQFKISVTPAANAPLLKFGLRNTDGFMPNQAVALTGTPDASGFYTVNLDLTTADQPRVAEANSFEVSGSVSSATTLAVKDVVLVNEQPANLARFGLPTSVAQNLTATANADCAPVGGLASIDRRIYGTSPFTFYAAQPQQWDVVPGSVRWGGDQTSLFNPNINALNSGRWNGWGNFSTQTGQTYPMVWQEPITGSSSHVYGGPTGDTRAGVAYTLPAMSYVAKDTSTANTNGALTADGVTPVVGMPWSAANTASWATQINSTAAGAANPVPLDGLILENEPDLWNDTHRDVYSSIHPGSSTTPVWDGLDETPPGYDWLVGQLKPYAQAVRTALPSAPIAGPALAMYTNMFVSPYDWVAPTRFSDYTAHSNTPFLQWYLSQMNVAGQPRLVDVLDQHFYPSGPNGSIGVYSSAIGSSVAKLRLRSTKSLWDPDYADESWISSAIGGTVFDTGVKATSYRYLRLIPRLRSLITPYPGMKTSIGEWNFGAEDHITGGLATAEALGQFGVNRLDSAYYWNVPPTNSPAYWAFRAFRNYDVANGTRVDDRFLSNSVPVTTTSTGFNSDDRVSVFSSVDSAASGRMTLVMLNLSYANQYTTTLNLANCGTVTAARKWTYDGGTNTQLTAGTAPTFTASSATVALAPASITVIELDRGTTATQKPVLSTAPVVSGLAVSGQVLSTTDGLWTNSPTGYAYQWQRCSSPTVCPPIAGATSSTYTLVAADVGSMVRSTVLASNSAGAAVAGPAPSSNMTAVVTGVVPKVIYDDALQSSFLQNQWNFPLSVTNLASTTPVFAGTKAVRITTVNAWEAMSLNVPDGLRFQDYTTLEFYISGGSASLPIGSVYAALHDASGSGPAGAAPATNPTVVAANTWTKVSVPIASLVGGNVAGFDTLTGRLLWIGNTFVGASNIDSIRLVP